MYSCNKRLLRRTQLDRASSGRAVPLSYNRCSLLFRKKLISVCAFSGITLYLLCFILLPKPNMKFLLKNCLLIDEGRKTPNNHLCNCWYKRYLESCSLGSKAIKTPKFLIMELKVLKFLRTFLTLTSSSSKSL